MSIGETLTRPVGPLPVWGWAAVGVGGVIIYRRIRGGSSSAAQYIPVSSGASGASGTGSSSDGTGSSGTPSTDNSSAILAALKGIQDTLSGGTKDSSGNQNGSGGTTDAARAAAQAAVDRWRAAVATMQGYIAKYTSLKTLTPRQRAALAEDRKTLAYDQQMLSQAEATLASLSRSAGVIATDTGFNLNPSADNAYSAASRQVYGTSGVQGAPPNFWHGVGDGGPVAHLPEAIRHPIPVGGYIPGTTSPIPSSWQGSDKAPQGYWWDYIAGGGGMPSGWNGGSESWNQFVGAIQSAGPNATPAQQGASWDAAIQKAFQQQNPGSYQDLIAQGMSPGFLAAEGITPQNRPSAAKK